MKHKVQSFILPILLSILVIQIILSFYPNIENAGTFNLKQAQFIMSDAETPPVFTAQSSIVSLPDNWNTRQFGIGGNGWYRMQIHMSKPQGNQLWALFVPRANMNIAVFINGIKIGDSGHFLEPMSRNWQRPLFFTLAGNTLHQGTNTIDIRLKSYAYEGGGMSRLLLGFEDALQPLFEQQFMVQINVSIVAFFLNMFATLIALILWFMQKNDKSYAWFALISFSSSLFIINNIIHEIPVDRDTWHFAVYVSIGWFALGLLGFSQSFTQKQSPRWFKPLLLYMMISSIIIMLLHNIFIALFWHIGSLIMASYACFILLKQWLQTKQRVYLLLYTAFLFILFVSFHDWYTRLTGQQFSAPILMHFGIPMMLIAISIVLGIRFAHLAKENASFNSRLIQQVYTMKSKLEVEHIKVQALLKQETQVIERERIMQDLHDGLGSYLISANSIARLTQADQGLQQALQDAVFWLRTSMDTLDSTHEDIGSLLGTLRHRLEPQLKSCGISLQWHMDTIIEHQLSSEHKFHLIRIVQESITNVLKHANASTISIATRQDANQHIQLEIRDNGCGMSTSSHGRGLSHMRERINALGGKLTLSSSSQGTTLRFTFKITEI